MKSTFALGGMTISRILEQQLPLFDAFTFFPTLTPELLAGNRSWLEPDAFEPGTAKVVLAIQSYLVRTPH
ncbi:MAG: hypothetical protein ACREF0_08550, partial [Acetobacteraceae bacterium]